MKTRHDYHAEWTDGKGIRVVDGAGNEIKVSYGATADVCTCYAYTPAGFIGGWNCQPKAAKLSFRDLIPAINAGVLCDSIDELPTGARYRRRRTVYC